jgi:2-dehydro-3-deoxyphosphogluconate aldolase/(4S)-4-hydroxy-2-oxoglutarate aldolase
VGGSWLVPADVVKAKDWDKVTELAKQAIANVTKG